MERIITWIKANPLIAIGIAVVIIGIIYFASKGKGSNNSSDLASCLKNKGAKFYGGYRCPKCKAQKQMFGTSASNLPYIECEQNGDGQKQCMDVSVIHYPTWIFANGKRTDGQVLSMEELRQLSGC